MSTHLVFTYGTLKRGYRNHHFLDGCELVSEAVTADRFYVTCVGFPIAHRRGKRKLPVRGEVYRVSDEVLASLDHLEGVPHHYQRELVRVQYPSREDYAHMYTQQRPRWQDARECQISGGTYLWRSRR